MSLLHFDSPKKYAAIGSMNGVESGHGAGSAIAATEGRNSEPAWELTSGNPPTGCIFFNLGATIALGSTIVIGRHVRIPTLPASSRDIISLHTGSAALSSVLTNVQARLQVNSDGTLTWGTGNFTARATSTLGITANTSHFVEVKVTLQTGASGTLVVRIDGIDVIGGSSGVSGSSLITTAAGDITQYGIIAGAATGVAYCDVCYALNTSGAAPWNDLLGNVQTKWKPAAADTAQKDFSRSTGADNYALVDDVTDDADSTYTHSATAGHKDRFTHAGDIISSTIFGVKAFARARKEAAGAMGFKVGMYNGTTETKDSLRTPPTSYQSYALIRGPNPDTSAAFSTAEANASQPQYEATTTV